MVAIMSSEKPKILVLGSTGQTGQFVAEELEKHAKILTVVYSSRRKEQVEKWKKEGRQAVLLDLDDPTTFAGALYGVDRLFLVTGYSVAMLTQSKTIVDAAKKAGVQHIVHLGVFSERDSSDPHYVWHELVESYIRSSGMAWTCLHPNIFMENLFTPNFINGGMIMDFFGGLRVGWVATSDIGKLAAATLREGPQKHGGKDYWLSCEVLTVKEVGGIVSDVVGKEVPYALKAEQDFDKYFSTSTVWNEKWYTEGVRVFFRQVRTGEMGYVGTVRDDFQYITGQPSTKLKEWAAQNKDALLQAVKRPTAF